MELFIIFLIAVAAIVSCWLWLNLPNKFIKLVISVTSIVFGVAVGISGEETYTYTRAAAATFMAVILWYILIRIIDLAVNGRKNSLFKKEDGNEKPKYFRPF